MKVEYTRRAQQDLAEIHAHVATQDTAMARLIAAEIKMRCEALEHFPFAGRAQQPGSQPPSRPQIAI